MTKVGTDKRSIAHEPPHTRGKRSGQNHACRRCGTCCRKGGPALHVEDQPLVVSGKIALQSLFTIRQGEPAYDNIKGQIEPAATDIIKIKGRNTTDTVCIFYRLQEQRCDIYADRPLECRALTCWDTRKIEAVYQRQRLTRGHLLARVEGLWTLIADHQRRCDYDHVAQWAAMLRQGTQADQAATALLEMLRYDHSLRQVMVERTRLDAGILPFLLGRPLTDTLPMFSLRRRKKGSSFSVEPL